MAGSKKRKRRRRPTKAQRRRRRQLASLLLAAALAGVWWWLGDSARLGRGGPPEHDPSAELRVVTWNLENFAGDPEHHDLARIAEVIEELDADVIALQEIKRPEALAEILPGWTIETSDRGGRGHQKVGIAWRPDRVERVDGPLEHGEVGLDGRVRPALSMYLRGRPGPDFWVTVVHLKAMPDGHDERRAQWPLLVEVGRDLRTRDADWIVVGDFNSTGAPGSSTADEHRELAAAFGPAQLRRIPNASGCSAYWDGDRRDAWKEPSEIDLVWVRGLTDAVGPQARVHSGTHCAEHRCRDFRSTDAYPILDYERVSDHCPVVLDIPRDDPSHD